MYMYYLNSEEVIRGVSEAGKRQIAIMSTHNPKASQVPLVMDE